MWRSHREIFGQVGLGTNILSQSEFISGEGKDALVQLERADGFAQVFPENKFLIVKTLQDGDHIVGMTGDGVNNAPALREADSGIAVAGATDAAKSAADIVLTKPGLLGHHRCNRADRDVPENGKLRGIPDCRDREGADISYTLYRALEFYPVPLS